MTDKYYSKYPTWSPQKIGMVGDDNSDMHLLLDHIPCLEIDVPHVDGDKVLTLDLYPIYEGRFNSHPLYFPYMNTIVMIFSLGNRTTLDNVQSRWKPEFDRFCPKTPIVLVGNNNNCNNNPTEQVLQQEAEELAQNIKAEAYFELIPGNVECEMELFRLIGKISLTYEPKIPNKNKRKFRCTVL